MGNGDGGFVLLIFEEMKNTLIHNCIGSHTNCFMSLLKQSSVTTNFEKALQYYTLSILHSSNLALFQSYTLPILQASNLILFQSYSILILHSSNLILFQIPILQYSNLT